MICNLCPRKCNAIRTAEGNRGGFCKAPESIRIARADLHFWEEPPISGKNGSGTVFFSGCSLNCVYCQNYGVSQKLFGKNITVSELSDIFKQLEEKGAHNINLVTPDHYVEKIKEALLIYRPKIPIVYNSGGYVTQEQIGALKDFIDIFLMDYKYISGEKAEKYSSAPDYPEVVSEALDYAYKLQPNCEFDKNGIMQKGLIIRHLLLPMSTNDAIKIFDVVKRRYEGAYFSIMAQYLPMGNAQKHPEINRKITRREYEKVVNHIMESGFENCFIQELSSADKSYIPDFETTFHLT